MQTAWMSCVPSLADGWRRFLCEGWSDMSEGSPHLLLDSPAPLYETALGAAYLGDALDLLASVPDASVNLIVTSPPFALRRKKEYGNVDPDQYVAWFLRFAPDLKRVLAEDGSLVIDIGGSWESGQPTRSLYHFDLLIVMVREAGFHLAQEFFWYNPACIPSPAPWVTLSRVRVKSAVDTIWWLSKTLHPKANNRSVLVEYSADMRAKVGKPFKTRKPPSGHVASPGPSADNGGAIPSNLLQIANTESNSHYLRACAALGIKPHPARFPADLPRFFIRFLTDPGDVVLDPFAGSNVTGSVCEQEGRRWLAFELREDYLRGSRLRFDLPGLD